MANAAAHNRIASRDSRSQEMLTSMETLTLVIEAQLATRARQVAQQRNTTVDSLVTEFLSGLTSGDETSRQAAAQRLVATIDASHVASAVAMSSSTLVSNRNPLIRHRA